MSLTVGYDLSNANDSIGTLNLSQGNAAHAVTFSASGIYGNAATTTSDDDSVLYRTVSDEDAIDPINSARSYSLWVKFASWPASPTERTLFAITNGTSGIRVTEEHSETGGIKTVSFSFYKYNSGSWSLLLGTTVSSDDEPDIGNDWLHVVITQDPAASLSSQMTIAIIGVPRLSRSFLTGTSASYPLRLSLFNEWNGATWSASSHAEGGTSIDEFRVYNHQLSQTEIEALWNSGYGTSLSASAYDETPSGGILAGGEATVSHTATASVSVTSFGLEVLGSLLTATEASGEADVNAVYNHESSGGILANGDGHVVYRIEIFPEGVYVGSDVSGGSAINVVYSESSSGGATLGGRSISKVSGVFLGGEIQVWTRFRPVQNTARAGVLLAGDASPLRVRLNPETTGGTALGGFASVSDSSSDFIPSGGAAVSGDGLPYGPTYGIESYGALAAGTATVPLTSLVSRGGLVANGGVTITGTTNLPANGVAQGGLVAGSGTSAEDVAEVTQFRAIANYNGGGEIQTLGSAGYGVSGAVITSAATGPLLGGSASDVNLTFNKVVSFSWNTHAAIQKDVEFLWNTGQLRSYWYRIIGAERESECEPLQGEPCCQRYVLNIHARSLRDLCLKISQRNYRFTILQVDRFTRPAENSQVAADEAAGISHDCNVLVPVEVCEIPECADYCVQYDVRVPMGIHMKVQMNAFHTVEAAGAAYLGGKSGATLVRIVPNFPYESDGGISLGGTIDIQTDHYSGQGGTVMAGSASLQHSRWSYVAGQFPETTDTRFGRVTESVQVDSTDQVWSLTDRVTRNDNSYSSTDISYGKTSEFLVVSDLRFNIPENATIMGVIVRMERFATQIGVRDTHVYLLNGADVVSNNLAVTGVDWPLINTNRTYGNNGLTDDDPWTIDGGTQLTPEVLNSEDFAIAIRVAATSALPNVIAKVDWIDVEVFYEFEDASRLRIGGESSTASQSYHYSGTGSVEIGSNNRYRVGYRFSARGPAFLSGHGCIQYVEVPSGGASLGGESRTTPFMETAQGGAKCGGDPLITPYFESGSGGALASGIAKLTMAYRMTATDGVVVSNDAFVPTVVLRTTGTGSVSIAGAAVVRSSNYSWESDGNAIFVGGSTDTRSSDITVPTLSVGFGMVVLQTTATFESDVHVGDADVLAENISKCGCLQVPLTIQLTHNIARNNIFANFLARNGLTLSRTVNLNYNSPNDSWQANLHYRGRAADSNTIETWTLVFEVMCTDTVGGISIGRDVWKTAVQVFRRNQTTGVDYETRVVVAILPEEVCGRTENQLNFRVAYDTELNVAVVTPNATVYQNTLFDNIGLFKNRSWVQDPELNLLVSQSVTDDPVRRLNLTDVILNTVED